MRRLLLAALLLLPLRALAAEPPSPDDTARFLAGLSVPDASPLAPLANDRAWKQQAAAFDAAFGSVEKRQLAKIRAWSGTHVTGRRPTVFYLFSGPDFLHANSFFPDAATYVMAGLEPVGAVPDLSAMPRDRVAALMRPLRTSLKTVLDLSFFKTNDMRSDLRASPASGALPVLYVFLARAGKTVRRTEFVRLDAAGTVTTGPATGPTSAAGAPGVRIAFAAGDGPEQTLYYFSTDLSNAGFRKSGLEPFCTALGIGDGLLKSASYLLHGGGFSQARNFLLRRTATIVQDDTGIPAAAFGAGWRLQPFGRYGGPIDLFSTRYQPKLAELFRRQSRGPLGFSIGYRYRPNEAGLVVATQETPPPTP